VLNKSSLSRLWKHNTEHDCGAITAFRKGKGCGEGEVYTKKEKEARNKSLLSKLISLGYDVTSLKGKYPEGGGEIVNEHSFFVVDVKDSGKLLKNLKKFGKMFDQDSILFVPKGSISGDSEAFLISTNNCPNAYPGFGKLGVKEKFNKGTLGKDSPIYTSYIKGRPFIFEEVDNHIHTPGNGFGWWSLHNTANKTWKELVTEDDNE